MAISLIRELSQKQKITLTPQLKKSIDLLQLSRYEIIQKINEEIDINPFLEKIEIDSSEGELNDDFFSSEYEKDVVAEQSLRENLLEQLNDLSLSKDDYLIAESIINSLDDSGELIEGIDEIENLLDFKFSFKKIEKVLTDVIHLLDPAGVGFSYGGSAKTGDNVTCLDNYNFLKETGVLNEFRHNDSFLRPSLVSNCFYDFVVGSVNSIHVLRGCWTKLLHLEYS